jgi:hypothetical protein
LLTNPLERQKVLIGISNYLATIECCIGWPASRSTNKVHYSLIEK